MWCSALLGMCTKFSEVTLAVHFRERNANGELVGGPMYYIKNGLAKHWRWLAAIYALFGVLTVFGTGNATQVNTIITAIDAALNQYAVVSDKAMATVNLVIGIVVAMLVALVLLGGVKRIGSVSEKLVPFMALTYVVLALGVVLLNLPRLPEVFTSLWRGVQPGGLYRRRSGQLVPEHAERCFPRNIFQRSGPWHRLHCPRLRRHQKAGQAGRVRHL